MGVLVPPFKETPRCSMYMVLWPTFGLNVWFKCRYLDRPYIWASGIICFFADIACEIFRQLDGPPPGLNFGNQTGQQKRGSRIPFSKKWRERTILRHDIPKTIRLQVDFQERKNMKKFSGEKLFSRNICAFLKHHVSSQHHLFVPNRSPLIFHCQLTPPFYLPLISLLRWFGHRNRSEVEDVTR